MKQNGKTPKSVRIKGWNDPMQIHLKRHTIWESVGDWVMIYAKMTAN